ncbi:unnamed protein product [Amoebophrya sp. A25]|nr:unnamed protein product [Amoebophrya sp. A25]|eukprot:GSA25T00019706001.1
MVVNVPQVISHVLGNPASYPGPHNVSQERTSQGLQKVDTTRQMKMIYDALTSRLDEMLRNEQSVSIDNLGSFSFAPSWYNSKYGPDFVAKVLCFVPHAKLANACPNYKPSKQKLELDRTALTTAQSIPSKVKFLNEVPIAAGTYYKTDLVKSVVKHFFVAVVDLAERGYDIDLDMKAAKIKIAKGNVTATFDSSLSQKFAEPVKPMNTAMGTALTKGLKLSETWAKPAFSDAMGSFLPRPKSREAQSIRIGTANLGVMGRDLTSCVK